MSAANQLAAGVAAAVTGNAMTPMAATASAASAAAAPAAAAVASCPNWSPLMRAVTTPLGGESLWFTPHSPPAWVLLSHSAQGLLGLFSLKQLALMGLPTAREWFEKLASLRTEGQIRAARRNSAGGAGESEAAHEALAATLMASTADVVAPAAVPGSDDDTAESSGARRPSNGSSSTSRRSSRSNSAHDSALSGSATLPAAASTSSIAAASTPAVPAAASAIPAPTPQRALLQQLYDSSSSDRIATLGSNMQQHVLSFLAASELARVMSVSRTWYRNANADHLWSKLNERALMQEFLDPESGLYELVQCVEAEAAASNDGESSASVVAAPAHAAPAASAKKRSWDAVIQSNSTQLRNLIIRIGQTWRAFLVADAAFNIEAATAPPSAVALQAHQLRRQDTEEDYLELAHQLTGSIQKLHSFLQYVREAERHARQVVQLAAAAKGQERSMASSHPSAGDSSLGARFDNTAALLLTASALVQACHRFCSGAAAPKGKPPGGLARKPSSSSVAARSPGLGPSSSPSSTSSQSSSEEASLSSEHSGLRRRRAHGDGAAADDELPAMSSRPPLAASASVSSASSATAVAASSSAAPSSAAASSSALSPPLSRSRSTPSPRGDGSASSGSSLLQLLPARRWHTVDDILLLMETSSLVHFQQFNVEENLRLHGPEAQARAIAEQLRLRDERAAEARRLVEAEAQFSVAEKKVLALDREVLAMQNTLQAALRAQQQSVLEELADAPSEQRGALQKRLASIQARLASLAASSEADSPGGASSTAAAGSGSAGGSSVFRGPPGDGSDDDSSGLDDSDSDNGSDNGHEDSFLRELDDSDSDDEEPPPLEPVPDAAAPLLPAHLPVDAAPALGPAPEAAAAAPDAVAIPDAALPAEPAAALAAAADAAAGASRSRRPKHVVLIAEIDSLGNIFLTSLRDTDSIVPSPTQAAATSAAAGPAASTDQNDSPAAGEAGLTAEEISRRALNTALESHMSAAKARAEAASSSLASKRRPPAYAKAAFKESLQFRRVQQGLDADKRNDRKLRASQEDNMQMHETLRAVFKLITFASLILSLNNVGLPHVLARYGALALALLTSAAAFGWWSAGVDELLDCRFFFWRHHEAILQDMIAQQEQGENGGHGLADGGANGAAAGANMPLNVQPLQQSAFMRVCARVLDTLAMWGPPQQQQAQQPNHPQANHANGNALVELPDAAADAAAALEEILHRKHLRRAALFVGLYLFVEAANWMLGSRDPAWFTSACMSGFRLLPCAALLWTLASMLLGHARWRSREVLGTAAAALVLEGAFWATGWRNETVLLMARWGWSHMLDSFAPAAWSALQLLLRVAPLCVAVPCFLWLLAQLFVVLCPVVLDAIAPPPNAAGVQLINLNPAAQPWAHIFHLLAHHPELRLCYVYTLASAALALGAELVFLHFDMPLPFVPAVWSWLKHAAPVLGSLAYEVAVFESRGAMIALAAARFILVVHRSLPLRSLELLTKKSKPRSQSSKKQGPAGSNSSAGSAAGAVPAADLSPSLLCLSCSRHRAPFLAVRCAADLVFEMHHLLAYPLSGVQGLHLQKLEMELQLIDTEETVRLERDRLRKLKEEAAAADDAEKEDGAEEAQRSAIDEHSDDEDDALPPVYLHTCNGCVLHSVRMQLLLPFLLCLLVCGAFAVLFAPPPSSAYSAVLSHVLHFWLDRVPALVLIDIGLGWSKGRVLQHARLYWAASAAVLLYAWWSLLQAPWAEVSLWAFLLPGVLSAAPYARSSSIVLDLVWLALWTIN